MTVVWKTFGRNQVNEGRQVLVDCVVLRTKILVKQFLKEKSEVELKNARRGGLHFIKSWIFQLKEMKFAEDSLWHDIIRCCTDKYGIIRSISMY